MSSWPSTSCQRQGHHRDGQLGANEAGNFRRYGLDQEQLGAGLVDRARVLYDCLSRIQRATLGLVAAELTGALRRQADVPTDNDAGVTDRLMRLATRTPPSSLMASHVGLLRKRPHCAQLPRRRSGSS